MTPRKKYASHIQGTTDIKIVMHLLLLWASAGYSSREFARLQNQQATKFEKKRTLTMAYSAALENEAAASNECTHALLSP